MAKALFFLLFTCVLLNATSYKKPIFYKQDTTKNITVNKRVENSHIKVYLPSIPYAHVMRLINGTLVRLSSSKKGWEYFIAYKHKKIDPLTYDFWLRDDVKFQDGTPLDANSVVENFSSFQKGAFTYTDIHNKLKYVEKLDKYKIRIHLNKPYGMLLNDLARIHLYTSKYLKKYPWSKSTTGVNTKATGAYGAGPYMLISGYATSSKQSKTLVLKANPYYFEKNKPHIQTITIYTKLPIDDVIHKITKQEGQLDIAIIPFNKKTEVINSPYAKLVSTHSSANLSIHMNLMKKNSQLKDIRVRQALNDALDQDKLITFVYKDEGVNSPFLLSANSYFSSHLSQQYRHKPKRFTDTQLHSLLRGLRLKVVTQDRHMFLWKGIEYQLKKYGVSLSYEVYIDEINVLTKLLTNRKNRYDWDLLVWGNDDWYGHPWTVFFALYTKNQWSSVDRDIKLDKKFRNFFEIESTSVKFQPLVNEILRYTYDKAYMLAVPSPNFLLALNKEVYFVPSPVAILQLWNAKITPYHWSLRGKKRLPNERRQFFYPQKFNDE